MLRQHRDQDVVRVHRVPSDCAVFDSAGSRAVMTRVWYCARRARSSRAAPRGRGRARRWPRRGGPGSQIRASRGRAGSAVRRLERAEQESLREPQHVQRAKHDAEHRAHREDEHGRRALQIRLPRCPNAPSSTRNSPVNPLVVGSPMEASDRIMKNTEYTGSDLGEAAVRRELAAVAALVDHARP